MHIWVLVKIALHLDDFGYLGSNFYQNKFTVDGINFYILALLANI